ncbi:MAG: T9SS type A sorting domain-containing protein [Bacteroidales bacterium]|nr:T9SS type A sorting domain-containing protein [Bacteroidales bacterium]
MILHILLWKSIHLKDAGTSPLIKFYPNPCSGKAHITVTGLERSRMTIALYNLQGEKLSTIMDEKLNAGCRQITWDTQGLKNGVYILQVVSGRRVQSEKIVIRQ